MKTLFKKKFKKVILTSLVAVFTLSFASFSAQANDFAFAESENTAKAELFLPSSELEYKALNSPIDIYSDDSVTAIVHNNSENDTTSLLICTEGQYKQYDSISITQVKKADAENVFILDNAKIFSVNISTLLATPLVAINESQLTGTYFDLNENYLITAFGKNALVYEKTLDGYVYKTTFKVNADYPVAINEKGQIFYILSENGITSLYYSAIDDLTTQNLLLESIHPSKMVANNDYLYFIEDNVINRISIINKQSTSLPDDGTMTTYDLGNVKNPTGIAFRKNNLIISDGYLNAVQEFRVNDFNKLEFTGFAIANGKSAYNRTSNGAIDVEKCDNTIATLDEKQLTINKPISEDKYARVNFKNFFDSDFGGTMPTAFALGKNTALLSFNHGDSLGYLKLLNLSTGELSEEVTLFDGDTIKEICYQSGYYYAFATSGATKNEVYRASETDFSFGEPLIKNVNSNVSCMTADVFGNVYLANPDNGSIYFCDAKNSYNQTKITVLPGVSKIATDLSGRLYLLSKGVFYVFNGQNLEDITPSIPNPNNTIKSFTMSYDKKDVYFIFNGAEYVCRTDSLNNYALEDIAVSDNDFKLTAPTTQFENLRIATVSENTNVYSVKRNGEGFDFNGLISPESEYVFVCDVVFDDNFTLCALVGQNGTILVNKNDVTFTTPQQSERAKSLYVTTDSHLYYFPIITPKTTYALLDQNAIKLTKGTEIQVSNKVKFLDKEFYFATATVNGKEVSGYIPVTFTANNLAGNFELNDYTIVTLNQTEFFSDVLFETKIADISKGQKVRLISIENGVAKVAVAIDNEFVVGYVDADDIDNAPARAIRNILVIVAVGAAICSSALYFVLKKRRN